MNRLARTPLLLTLLLAGCLFGISDEEAQSRWDDFVSTRNACETVDECVIVVPGCPLGCNTAVNAEYDEEALDYAEQLVSQTGSDCEYKCAGATLACEESRCTAVDATF